MDEYKLENTALEVRHQRRHSCEVRLGLVTPPDSPIGANAKKAPVEVHASDSSPPQASITDRRKDSISATKVNSASDSQRNLHQRGYSTACCHDHRTEAQNESLVEEICSVVEHVAEQTMADATATLRMNLRKMEQSLHHLQGEGSQLQSSLRHLQSEGMDMKELNDTYNRQIDLHYRLLEKQEGVLFDALQTQSKTFQTQSETLQAQSKATTDNLLLASGMIGQLSQIVANLPNAVHQVVNNAVQQQVQRAIQDVLDAQRHAMLSLFEQSTQQRELDFKASSAKVSSKHVTIEPSLSSLPVARGGRLGRTMKRLFRCGRHG